MGNIFTECHIVSAAEMAAGDQYTFSKLGIPSRGVMEIAGREVAREIMERLGGPGKRFAIFCGPGNNGGDGFIIARLLKSRGMDVHLFSVKEPAALKGDAKGAADSFLMSGGVVHVATADLNVGWAPLFDDSRGQQFVFIDAIFGTGFKSDPSKSQESGVKAIDWVNDAAARLGATVVSVDLPSGLDADSSECLGPVVRAKYTISLQALKPAHVHFPAATLCGVTTIVDIGVDITGVKKQNITRLITPLEIHGILRELPAAVPQSHKGKRGHVLVIGGSSGKFGAVRLCGEGALRSGAGLVTLVFPESAAREVAPTLEELMCESLPEDDTGGFSGEGDLHRLIHGKRAVIIGPGMGTSVGSVRLLKRVLEVVQSEGCGLVIDADALNIIAGDKQLLKLIPKETILTPHPGEMSRLVATDIQAVERERVWLAVKLAKESGAIVTLKGARTVIASPAGEVRVNPAALGALGTAGSGDVLAGVIGGFVAQLDKPFLAAITGVFLHGAAAELLVDEASSNVGLTAGDLPRAIARAVARTSAVAKRCQKSILSLVVLPGSFAARVDCESDAQPNSASRPIKQDKRCG